MEFQSRFSPYTLPFPHFHCPKMNRTIFVSWNPLLSSPHRRPQSTLPWPLAASTPRPTFMSPVGHRGLQGSRHVLWSNRANAGHREAGQHGADRPVTSSPSAEGCGMREEGAGPLSMKMAGRVTAQAHPLTAWGWMHNTLPNPSFPYPHPRSQSTSPSPRLTRAGRPEGCEFWQFLLFHRRKRNPQVDVPLFCRVASSQTPPPAFPCGQACQKPCQAQRPLLTKATEPVLPCPTPNPLLPVELDSQPRSQGPPGQGHSQPDCT